MKNLFVGNIAWGATDEALRDLFAQFGEVYSAKIIMDRETGRSRGFGFVEMENAEAAIEGLNGADFFGREIRVNIAEERRPSRPARQSWR